MKLEIEKYLRKNRLRLDAENHNEDKIWKEIEGKLKPERKNGENWFWKIAAVFLLGVLSTYIVVKESSDKQVVIITLADISEDLGKKEADLKLVVDKKWSEIGPLSQSDKLQFQFLLDELQELDGIYELYENDLQEHGVNEQTIQVLLDYYEKKIRILNRLSLEIEKQKSHENKTTI